jgi:hypothetical protein
MALNAHHRRAIAARIAAAAVVTTLVLLAAAGCGSGTSPGGSGSAAGSFIKDVTTQFSRGQSGRLWDSLLPSDQAIVSRARYMACESSSGFDLTKFKVLETYPDTIQVSGKATPSTAVSVRVTSDDGVTTATMHAVKTGGTWRWLLSPRQRAAYSLGKCPTA